MHKHFTSFGTVIGGILGAVIEPGKILEIAVAAIVGGLCGEAVKHSVAWLKGKVAKKK